MIGFLIGTACLIGLIRTLRGGHRRFGYGYGGHGFGGGGCHGGGDWHGRGWGHRSHEGWDHDGDREWGGPPWARRGGARGGFLLRMLSERLDATPAQEKVVAEALREIREAFMKHRGELSGSRADIAKAVRAEGFDEVLFGELFARQDLAIEDLRKTTMGAIGKVHEALEPEQRERLARIIEGGSFRGMGRGFGGPFRGGMWA